LFCPCIIHQQLNIRLTITFTVIYKIYMHYMNNGSLALNLIISWNQKYYREHVNRSLTEQRALLSSALNAVIEALRMNPDKYAVIYIIMMTITIPVKWWR
jgi:hypothetical protein